MRKLSEFVGMQVFSDQGKRLGTIYDAILDMQQGHVVRFSLAPLNSSNTRELVEKFKNSTIIFHNISQVGDSIIVSTKPFDRGDMLESGGEDAQAPVQQAKRHPYSYRYRR
jgi:sporulation protein YlmC with PRC-barrel domain